MQKECQHISLNSEEEILKCTQLSPTVVGSTQPTDYEELSVIRETPSDSDPLPSQTKWITLPTPDLSHLKRNTNLSSQMAFSGGNTSSPKMITNSNSQQLLPPLN